jgi:hypothetical protein
MAGGKPWVMIGYHKILHYADIEKYTSGFVEFDHRNVANQPVDFLN